jgi:CDP-6-deoxy-D-xylo-4-hexulose-3-dehydrase
MNNVFWVGVYPGLTPAMLDYIADTITAFVESAHSLSRSTPQDLTLISE